jgi:hypothetical protein
MNMDWRDAMARRWRSNMRGEKYLGNAHTKEVHDLDNEDTRRDGCQIDEIIAAGHDRPFTSLVTAHAQGYDNCAKCLGGSLR